MSQTAPSTVQSLSCGSTDEPNCSKYCPKLVMWERELLSSCLFTRVQMLCCLLLLGVQSTAVRWSAAKGLARIAERLQPDMAAQVLTVVMELPSPAEVCALNLYRVYVQFTTSDCGYGAPIPAKARAVNLKHVYCIYGSLLLTLVMELPSPAEVHALNL